MASTIIVFAALALALTSAADFSTDWTLKYVAPINSCSKWGASSGATLTKKTVDGVAQITGASVLGGLTLNCSAITADQYFALYNKDTDILQYQEEVYPLIDNTDNKIQASYNCTDSADTSATPAVVQLQLLNGLRDVRVRVQNSETKCDMIFGETATLDIKNFTVSGVASSIESCLGEFYLTGNVSLGDYVTTQGSEQIGLTTLSAESIFYNEVETKNITLSCPYVYKGASVALTGCVSISQNVSLGLSQINVYAFSNGQILLNNLYYLPGSMVLNGACAEALGSFIMHLSLLVLSFISVFCFLLH